MITMKVDLKFKGLNEFAEDMKETVEESTNQLMGYISEVWADKAAAKLDTSLQRYLSARQLSVASDGKSIKLSIKGDKLAMWVEQGMPHGVDMRARFLKGRAYANIPLGPNGQFGFRRITSNIPSKNPMTRDSRGRFKGLTINLHKQYSYNMTGKNMSTSPMPYAGWGRSLSKTHNWYHPGIEARHIIKDVVDSIGNDPDFKKIFNFKKVFTRDSRGRFKGSV